MVVHIVADAVISIIVQCYESTIIRGGGRSVQKGGVDILWFLHDIGNVMCMVQINE